MASLNNSSLTPQYSYATNFIGGSLALSLSFALCHPLDSFKTQLQTGTKVALSRGFLTSFIMAGGLRLSAYEWCKSELNDYFGEPLIKSGSASNSSEITISPSTSSLSDLPSSLSDLPHLHLDDIQPKTSLFIPAVAACFGDTISSIVKVPREVIIARMQAGVDESLILKSKLPPTLVTIKEIIRLSGPSGLFKGFGATTLRDWPFMIILFTSYEGFKRQGATSPFYGGLSGALAAFLTTPFDVVKTRVMTSKVGLIEASRSVWSERGLMKGAGARSLWWFIVCSVFFPVYEKSRSYVSNDIGDIKLGWPRAEKMMEDD